MRKALFLCLLFLFLHRADSFADGDGSGVIHATTKLWADGSKSTTIVDPDQRTAEETVTDAAGKLMRRVVYLLDERNLALGAIRYDSKGNIRYKESYERDAADHVITSTYSTSNGRALGRRVFLYRGDTVTGVEDYDAQGNLIQPATPARAATRHH